MTAATLEYETPYFTQSLFGGDLSLLKHLETATESKITTRDGWIKIQGEEAGVTRAKAIFAQLEKTRRQGTEIDAHVFKFALTSICGGPPKAESSPRFDAVAEFKISLSPRKPPVIARTQGQLAYLQAIRHHDVTFGIGPAGTGKTFLAMASALAAYKAGEVQRIVLSRPAVEAGEALGFLPGDLNEKVLPYLRPLYDALYDMVEADEIEKMIERGQIEIAPLAYMRGRTLSRSFIILDEAQNTTQAQMFMLLTRLGEKSKCVITGDPSQVDIRDPRYSGLIEARRILPGTDGIGFIEFAPSDVVRHPVVQRIINAYSSARAANQTAPRSAP
jgi:phosphate starvation-inducible protein PhoH and related proteins